jgi:PiT family inorganic phosphate transporter
MNNTMPEPALLGVAATFAVVTGANDGGALLSTGLKLRGLRPVFAIGTLAVCVVAAPVLLSSAVAHTFTTRLISTAESRTPLLLGIAAAVLVVLALTQAGLPTSLTLAVIGGLTGSGLGYGVPVSLATAATVLGVGMLAPFAGGLLGYLLTRLLVLLPSRPAVSDTVIRTHRFAFGVQCVAYGVNDGQKMLAVFLIAGGAGDPSGLLLLCGCFVLGVLIGLPRVARSLGDGLFAVRPVHAVSAELAGAIAVLGSAAAGVPVSMTQSLAGGLVGAGVGQGSARIRWQGARRIWLAWLITLPASVLLAAALAAIVRVVT